MLGRQTHWRNYNKHVGFLTVGPKFTRPACRGGQQQLSIDICCLTSAANPPAAAAAVDRRDRQTYGHSTLTAYWPTCVEQSAAWTANVELYCLHLCGETKDIFIFGCRRVWELLKPRYINLHITLLSGPRNNTHFTDVFVVLLLFSLLWQQCLRRATARTRTGLRSSRRYLPPF